MNDNRVQVEIVGNNSVIHDTITRENSNNISNENILNSNRNHSDDMRIHNNTNNHNTASNTNSMNNRRQNTSSSPLRNQSDWFETCWGGCASCFGCDLSFRDLLILFLPFSWTVIAMIMFCYYVIHPIAEHKFPKTIPLYWSLISGIPAFVAGVNIYLFHRSAVRKTGLSRKCLCELSQILRLLSIYSILTFFLLAVSSVIQITKCPACENSSFEDLLWSCICILWMIIMACAIPSRKYYNKLIFKYETQNADENHYRASEAQRENAPPPPPPPSSVTQSAVHYNQYTMTPLNYTQNDMPPSTIIQTSQGVSPYVVQGKISDKEIELSTEEGYKNPKK